MLFRSTDCGVASTSDRRRLQAKNGRIPAHQSIPALRSSLPPSCAPVRLCGLACTPYGVTYPFSRDHRCQSRNYYFSRARSIRNRQVKAPLYPKSPSRDAPPDSAPLLECTSTHRASRHSAQRSRDCSSRDGARKASRVTESATVSPGGASETFHAVGERLRNLIGRSS